MNPNWSKLAALFRTLAILGASSFVGAIALPLATDGTLPTTWQAWRPILAVAGSAAAVSEFIWIRTHIQQAAQAIGVLSNDPSTSAPAKAALLKIGLGVMLVFLLSCAAAAPAIVPAADCGAAIIADALSGMTVEQIIADAVGPKCGADLIAVTHHDREVDGREGHGDEGVPGDEDTDGRSSGRIPTCQYEVNLNECKRYSFKRIPKLQSFQKRSAMTTKWVLIDETNGATTGDGSKLDPTTLARIAAACDAQMNNEFKEEYGGDYEVRAGSGPKDIKCGEQVYTFVPTLAQAPGASAYHDEDGNGVPVAFCAVTTCGSLLGPDGISVDASHELLEAGADPSCNLMADNLQGLLVAYEVGDPVEVQTYPSHVDEGVQLSNFVLRSWFNPKGQAPFDFMSSANLPGAVAPPGPLQIAPGATEER